MKIEHSIPILFLILKSVFFRWVIIFSYLCTLLSGRYCDSYKVLLLDFILHAIWDAAIMAIWLHFHLANFGPSSIENNIVFKL